MPRSLSILGIMASANFSQATLFHSSYFCPACAAGPAGEPVAKGWAGVDAGATGQVKLEILRSEDCAQNDTPFCWNTPPEDPPAALPHPPRPVPLPAPPPPSRLG